MRALLVFLIFSFCLLQVSCNQQTLPPIKDAETLRKECAALYQQFPTPEIPTNSFPRPTLFKISREKWPPSVVALNPIEVSKDTVGVFILLPESEFKRTENEKVIVGYFVHINLNETPFYRHHLELFTFKNTEFGGIYQVERARITNY